MIRTSRKNHGFIVPDGEVSVETLQFVSADGLDLLFDDAKTLNDGEVLRLALGGERNSLGVRTAVQLLARIPQTPGSKVTHIRNWIKRSLSSGF